MERDYEGPLSPPLPILSPPHSSPASAPQPSPSSLSACACRSNDTKTFQQLVDPPFQGSTALFSVFMSSPSVATLCSAVVWQCEGRLVAEPLGLRTNGRNLTDYVQLLSQYGRYWDLGRPVLVDKSPNEGMQSIAEIHRAVLRYPPYTIPGVKALIRAEKRQQKVLPRLV